MALRPVRKLLVEGEADKRVIPELIEKATGLPWGERRGSYLVDITAVGSDRELLAKDYIDTELKTAQLHSLGIVLDSDEDAGAQWRALRDRCRSLHPEFPEELPAEGLVLTLKSGVRLGAWLMPDNCQQGMLETFLLTLRPEESSPRLWQHVTEAVQQAKQYGAAWRQAHRDKALCHTFLAWQDPPGRQLHQALQEHLLDARAPAGQRFVAWFRRLYEV